MLGSHLAEELLKRGVQVVGIDDFSTGSKRNLSEVVKSRDFHLINGSIEGTFFESKVDIERLGLPRLDYAFFVAESESNSQLYSKGVHNFLSFARSFREKSSKETEKSEKPRVVLVSSINLYNNRLEKRYHALKEAEIRFAKYTKYYNLNARVIRLGTVFGPRMHFRQGGDEDPIVRLIQSSLLDKLQGESISLNFSTRAIFVHDAVELILRSVLSGSTADKIYDGLALQPIKAEEVKQILIDPVWHESRGFIPSELPPWPTPNLKRTTKELSWKPKTNLVKGLRETISYFKDSGVEIPDLEDQEVPTVKEPEYTKKWSFASFKEEDQVIQAKKDKVPGKGRGIFDKVKPKLIALLVLAVISAGLLYPMVSLVYGGLSIRSHLQQSKEAVERTDFVKAASEIKSARKTLSELSNLSGSLAILKRLNIFSRELDQFNQLTTLISEGVEGADFALLGSKDLFDGTKIISGESNADPVKTYESAQVSLTRAQEKLTKVQARLGDSEFTSQFHPEIKRRMNDFSSKLQTYSGLVERGRMLSFLIPEITAVTGEKSYLLLIQDNLELRPTGGFITSFGKLNFKNGKLVSLKVSDVKEIDDKLSDVFTAPNELKQDLKIDRLSLKDVNFEVDFPTSARQAELIYKRATGESSNGVIAINLNASVKLLQAVGGVKVAEISKEIKGDDLLNQHLITKASPNPNLTQDLLTVVHQELFNKIFYLANQNWPEVISAAGSSLSQKDLLIYLEDPKAFAQIVSEDWGGVLPRGSKDKEGEFSDFLALVESNIGASKANYYLQRTLDFRTNFSEGFSLTHTLTARYKNTSPKDAYPGGKLSERVKLYLPLGAKLKKITVGGEDITAKVASTSDYGRIIYSFLLEVPVGQERVMTAEYAFDESMIKFEDGKLKYRLDIFRQSGSGLDNLNLNFIYPTTFKATSESLDLHPSEIEGVGLSTRLSEDKSFVFEFEKK